MRCCRCGKTIEPGQHVYPGFEDDEEVVWHTTCGGGVYEAVMGSDGKLRWCESGRRCMRNEVHAYSTGELCGVVG